MLKRYYSIEVIEERPKLNVFILVTLHHSPLSVSARRLMTVAVVCDCRVDNGLFIMYLITQNARK